MSCHVCFVTGIRECNPQEAEIKCMVCGYCERQAVKDAMKPSTVLQIQCMHCKEIIGEKDGKGVTGMTSGICDPCKITYHGDILL